MGRFPLKDFSPIRVVAQGEADEKASPRIWSAVRYITASLGDSLGAKTYASDKKKKPHGRFRGDEKASRRVVRFGCP